jgi:hypothetical protein
MNVRTSAVPMVFGLLLLSSVAALAAVPVRQASPNGVNSSQPRMNLLGPAVPDSKDGGDVGVASQVICPNQDVADASVDDNLVFRGVRLATRRPVPV